MPSPFTPTFASAAASTNGDSASGRRDGTSGTDWSRNRVNGATQTFRRPSLATTGSQGPARDSSSATNAGNGGAYIPPHLNISQSSSAARLGPSADTRYSKDQLLNIFHIQKEAGALDRNLDDIFLGSWNPLALNNGTSHQSGGGRGEGKEQAPGPEVCWNYSMESEPFGLIDMTEEEKQLFASSVNSPIKPPQNTSKDSNAPGVIGGRKTSLSGYGSAANNSRPGTRRRETSDSFTNGPLSPSDSKTLFRNESNTATPPPALLRRRTDFKDDEPPPVLKEEVQDDGADSQTQPGTLRRAGTAPVNAGLNPPSSSPWSGGPQSSGFGSMGTFGSFSIGSSAPPPEPTEKRPGFGSARGGSRFKDLLSKTSAEDMSSAVKEKGSFGALEKLPEEATGGAPLNMRETFKTRPARSETNPYEDAPPRTGSAALSASQDGTTSSHGLESLGFSAFGPQVGPAVRDFGYGEGIYHQTPQARFNSQEPMSPTNTNPYQSPHGRIDDDERDANNDNHNNGNDGGTTIPTSQSSGLPSFGGGRRNIFPGSEDRGQTPGAAGQRSASGFGGLPGFGGAQPAPSWSSAGTPARERGLASSAFGDPIFSALSDLQSSSAAPIGSGFFGSAGFGSAGRANRLGAMFPPAMQEQMRVSSRNEMQTGALSRPDSAQQASSVRDPFEGGQRKDETFSRGPSLFEDSPSRSMDDQAGPSSQQPPYASSTTASQPVSTTTASAPGQRSSAGPESLQSGHGLSQSSGSSSSNQLPAAQQRQMVMPDRMRWIYRDPSGNIQGPWSGLEMHDWFKAGFFTAELQVKKLEDTEFEPLAQLVRRIGNSREPFLVPQIGVPHGPPTATQGNNWPGSSMAGASSGGAQPPFASSFPSFGTTLTAEQQNALERRKQEEQFLMARQKEHLAQQQVLMKQMQMQNAPHALHSLQHHSSAHSLQSQPSFGSITSPNAYQVSPLQGPIQPPQHALAFGQPPTSHAPHHFGANIRPARDDDLHNLMNQMSFSQRANFPFGSNTVGPHAPDNGPPSEQVAAMLQDRSRLQQQQQTEMRAHQDTFLGPQGRNDRLEEFHELHGQVDTQAGRHGPETTLPPPIGAQRHVEEPSAIGGGPKQPAPIGHPGTSGKPPTMSETEGLSLSQQVQRAAAAAESGWPKHTDAPGQAPPPASISPLPAPAAQRNRQHVADALAAESRSATQTPVETPTTSIAPWAERTAELLKGPSLKEIQEAEARRAAELQEIAAAHRRAQAEQERLAQAHQPPPQPGLPSTSTWGSSTSPAIPGTAATSVWAKQAAGKTVGTPANGPAKKTLAQIQKEEESRKQRAAAAAATIQAAGSPALPTVGKRYAELASKAAPAPAATSGGAWTTVGSGGKAKAPAAVVATPQTAPRTTSTGSTASNKPRPSLQTSRSATLPNQSKAHDEFTKWIKGSLGKGLNSNINLDTFVQDLLMLPPEIEIISDSVYANSQTLDGRRFAEEFVRRRKLADKGIVEPATNGVQGGAGSDGKTTGGWSEVAKKGPAPKDESNAAFKVVATKKKGKR